MFLEILSRLLTADHPHYSKIEISLKLTNNNKGRGGEEGGRNALMVAVKILVEV